MEGTTWLQILGTVFVSVVGGGGAVKMYELFKKGKHDDRSFISRQYRTLLKVEEERSARLLARIGQLEEELGQVKVKYTEAITESLTLKCELALCYQKTRESRTSTES